MIRLFSFWLFFFVSSAFAQSAFDEAPPVPKEFYMASEDGGRRIPIFTYSQEECVATIQHLLYPNSKIAEGLAALAESDLNDIRESSLKCLEETTKNWNASVPSPYVEMSGVSDGYDLSKIRELQNRLACYNPYTPDTPQFTYFANSYITACKDKWITPEQKSAMTLALEAENKKYEEFRKQTNEQQQRASQVTSLLTNYLRPSTERYYELDKRKQCHNPYPPESSSAKYFEASRRSLCGDKWISQEELKALEEELVKERAIHQKYEDNIGKKISLATSIYSSYRIWGTSETPELRDALKTVDCFNPYPENSYDHKIYFYSRPHCKSKPLVKDSPAVLQFVKLLGETPEGILARAEQARALYTAQQDRLQMLALRPRGVHVSVRLLLGRYQAFLRQGGKPEKVTDFCKENEASQKRDRHFFEITHGKHSMFVISPVGGYATNFANAEKFGLSPSELAALHFYMGSGYRTINTPLFSQAALGPDLQAIKETLDSALARFPSYNQPVQRHATLPPAVASKHVVGDVVCYDAYSSSSMKKEWNWGGPHRFIIYPGKRGRAVFEYSAGEGEVLFEAGTCFKVLSAQKKYSFTEFVMAEVDEEGEPIGFSPYDGSTP